MTETTTQTAPTVAPAPAPLAVKPVGPGSPVAHLYAEDGRHVAEVVGDGMSDAETNRRALLFAHAEPLLDGLEATAAVLEGLAPFLGRQGYPVWADVVRRRADALRRLAAQAGGC